MNASAAASIQLNLFEHVSDAFAASNEGMLDNARLYKSVAARAGIPVEFLDAKEPIGKSGQECSTLKRKIRWHQQTLKHLGLIEKVDSVRGLWRLTQEGKHKLKRATEGVALLAFSTSLGLAIWGDCRSVFSNLDVPINLVITSPPYPLARPRAYGNPSEAHYVDFICQTMEPVVAKLASGASICLNISNDIFEKGSPARSLYLERLVLAMHDRLGLFLMDRLVWHNPSKPPGPIQWASLKRVHLNVSYEPIIWLTNDPFKVKADNRNVLEAHSEKHLRLIAAGGEQREGKYADGAYTIKKGSFGNNTPGKIPRNILKFGHNCPDNREYRRDCDRMELPKHGATMPLALPDFLIRFLSDEGDLVADPFGGKLTTARAAEKLGRRWISTELILEYIRGAAERFKFCDGYWRNPAFDN